jgi:hypothetical protein
MPKQNVALRICPVSAEAGDLLAIVTDNCAHVELTEDLHTSSPQLLLLTITIAMEIILVLL